MNDANWYKKQAQRFVGHFQNDIDIDIELVRTNPDCEYFFFIRESGTHAIGLRDLSKVSGYGVHEPHLFGHKSTIDCIRAEVSAIDFSVAKDALAAYHYDPKSKKFYSTSYEYARQTIAAYLLTASNMAMNEGV